MYYYEVRVASHRYHGQDPLTYSSDETLPVGSVVHVQLRKETVEAIVVRATTKPKFVAKPIAKKLVESPLPQQSIELLEWLLKYYPAPSGPSVSLFLPGNLLLKQTNTVSQPIRIEQQPDSLPPLTQEQQSSVDAVHKNPGQTFLLHGETGSGKTRVYLELAKECLKNDKSALVLTPEIGLTSPLANTFIQAGLPTVVMHSNLSPKEKRQVWLRILTAPEPLVIIGPRSCLFTPVKNVGLIVIDEMHDSAYKQDQAPHYVATRVAGKLTQLHGATLVLGSATPPVSDYYVAKAKGLPILRMERRAIASDQPEAQVTLVNSYDKNAFTKDTILSDPLLQAVAEALRKNEQSLVFLNRRGTARLILCQSCGWQALCPNCDLPLTYHGDKHQMRCHTCGFNKPAATNCPTCGSVDIVFKSVGTKALENRLKRLFPEARVQRFDTDNLKDERFEAQYTSVAEGTIDILVGTQMLIKGHDLPQLSVVGVVAADSSLSFPDFTAQEQTYQLIRQVKGRVGRGHRAGHVIIQTYNPDSSAIQAAVDGSWETFFESQLDERKTYNFPPFVHLLKLICARSSTQSAEKTAQSLAKDILSKKLPVQIIGPAPRLIEKAHGKFQWQIIIKSKQRNALLRIIDSLPANWSHDIDPTNLL